MLLAIGGKGAWAKAAPQDHMTGVWALGGRKETATFKGGAHVTAHLHPLASRRGAADVTQAAGRARVTA